MTDAHNGAQGDKKKPVSRSFKAGLQFPVGRIHRFLKVRREPCQTRQPLTLDALVWSHASNPFTLVTMSHGALTSCPDGRALRRRPHLRQLVPGLDSTSSSRAD